MKFLFSLSIGNVRNTRLSNCKVSIVRSALELLVRLEEGEDEEDDGKDEGCAEEAEAVNGADIMSNRRLCNFVEYVILI